MELAMNETKLSVDKKINKKPKFSIDFFEKRK